MATIDTVQARLAAIRQELHAHSEAIRLLLLEHGRLTRIVRAMLNGQGQEKPAWVRRAEMYKQKGC